MSTIQIVDKEGFYAEKTTEAEPNGTYITDIRINTKGKRNSQTPSKGNSHSQKEVPTLVKEVFMICSFFKNKISHQAIINAIHHNEGLVGNAIIELYQDPSKYNSASLEDSPFHETDFPIENYYSYIKFGSSQ